MIPQILLAGDGMIDPTVAVGDNLFSVTDTRSYPGTGVVSFSLDNSYTIPNNWNTKTYDFVATTNSTAAYDYFFSYIYIYKNGVLVNSWIDNNSGSGYYKNNSGLRTFTQSLTLAKGDTVHAVVAGGGRGTGTPTPSSTITSKVTRTT